MPFVLKPKSHSEIDHRKAVLALRWLLIILASYLTLFSHFESEEFPIVSVVALVFALSNIVVTFVGRETFTDSNVRIGIAVLDVIFVCATLYFLRVPGNYLYLAFIGIFILALVWRDLRLVLFSLLLVSLLFGLLGYLRFFRFELEVNVEQFLTMALFFVVSIFYVFLFDRLT